MLKVYKIFIESNKKNKKILNIVPSTGWCQPGFVYPFIFGSNIISFPMAVRILS